MQIAQRDGRNSDLAIHRQLDQPADQEVITPVPYITIELEPLPINQSRSLAKRDRQDRQPTLVQRLVAGGSGGWADLGQPEVERQEGVRVEEDQDSSSIASHGSSRGEMMSPVIAP